jgi:hypothetical protein
MNRITLIQKDQIESELCCEKPVEEILVNGQRLLQIHEVCRDVRKSVRITKLCVFITSGIAILATLMVGYLFSWIHVNESCIQETLDQNIQVGQSQIKMKESKKELEQLGYIWDNQTRKWKKHE